VDESEDGMGVLEVLGVVDIAAVVIVVPVAVTGTGVDDWAVLAGVVVDVTTEDTAGVVVVAVVVVVAGGVGAHSAVMLTGKRSIKEAVKTSMEQLMVGHAPITSCWPGNSHSVSSLWFL
jgi:hypothetical protein